MKVSIDPVETFFSGITSVWGRALAFFGTCWISFGFGLLCSSFSWEPGQSLDVGLPPFEELCLLPFGWMFSIPAICLLRWWWGVPHGIYLAGALYAVMIVETDLFRSMLLLFIVECWHAFFVSNYEIFDLFSLFDPPWRIFLPFMFLMNAYAGWHVYATWRDARREEMPP